MDNSLPQLSTATYFSQVFWLVITFGALYFGVAKTFLPRMSELLRTRRQIIKRLESDAHNLNFEAQDLEARARDLEASLAGELAQARKNLQHGIRTVKQKSLEDLASESEVRWQKTKEEMSNLANSSADEKALRANSILRALTKALGSPGGASVDEHRVRQEVQDRLLEKLGAFSRR